MQKQEMLRDFELKILNIKSIIKIEIFTRAPQS